MDKSWIEETTELLQEWENEKEKLGIERDALENQLFELDRQITAGHALVQSYINKHNISLSLLDVRPGYFGDKTYAEMLTEIAQKRQGYLKVSDAVETMLKANVSADKRAMQANIYSALHRLKRRFVKIAPGEYRYVNHVRRQSDREPSGLRQRIRELKEHNPQMTKRDVLDTLLRDGFDFKGKKAANAVNITWAYLGYAKQEGQQEMALLKTTGGGEYMNCPACARYASPNPMDVAKHMMTVFDKPHIEWIEENGLDPVQLLGASGKGNYRPLADILEKGTSHRSQQSS